MTTRDTTPPGAPIWVDIMTPDAEVTRSFYGDLFGWTAEKPDAGFGGYFNFTRDGVRVAGGMQNDGQSGATNAWTVYLATADARATIDKVEANGGQVTMPPMQVGDLGTMGALLDPGQAYVGIWQPGSHKGIQVFGEAGHPAWFELHTQAYDAVRPFYREVFGWDIHVVSDVPEFRYATFGQGEDQHAGIMDDSVFGDAAPPAHWSVYFGVTDTDKAVARVQELGGSIIRGADDSPYGRLAEVADPTGVQFRLVDGVE